MVEAGEPAAVHESDSGSAAERALIRAGLAGDRAALEQLLSPHKRSLVAVCYGVLGSVEDAEDAAQEAFLRALRALRSFRGDSAFRSWLIRIALNICFSWKRARHPTESWEEETHASASGAGSPEGIALRHLRLMEALQSLPPHRRAALLLKEWEGYSMTEVGAVMGWNEARVKNELYRARRSLAEWQRRETAEGEIP
jgi:RNA polymerase sigma-70 factor, ECF subfamily